MKLNTDFAPIVKSSNTMETSQASIEMTPEMFLLLSVGVYQHPERACIRELSCNAIDGQTAAGCADKPFTVHLPTQLEPFFEVRDYGTGMTHEQVMKLYLTYGASTKRDSNDQIGGLGIGSKSPFAVAQSFTATSYQNGTVRRYTVYMENGIPQVTKLTEGATTEPNGMAVRVAVPINKIQKFHQEANRVYTHFPVKPNTNLPLTGVYDHMSILSEETGVFRVYSGQNPSNTISTGIVMGNIEYPINLNEVIPNIGSVVPQFLMRSIGHVLIDMPIGSVNIAASRESLQLTEDTRLTITAIFHKVAKEILVKFQDKLDVEVTLYDAYAAYLKALGNERMIDHNSLMRHLSWGGKTLHEWYMEQRTCRTQDMIDPATGLPALDYYGKKKTEPKFAPIVTYSIYGLRRHSERRQESMSFNTEKQFSIFEDMGNGNLELATFVIDDRFQKNGSIKTVGRGVILKAIAENLYNSNPQKQSSGRLFLMPNQAAIDELAALHHYPKDKVRVMKLSDFESAYVPKKSVRGNVKLWQCCNGGSFTETTINLEELDNPQYYIRATGNDLVTEGLRQTGTLGEMSQILSQVVLTKQVFMFRKAVWDKIPDEWIEISEDVLTKAIKESPELYIHMNRSVACNNAANTNLRLDRMAAVLHAKFDGRSVFGGNVMKGNTMGVNVEDNLEVFSAMFGRPQLSLAHCYHAEMRYETSPIEKLIAILPKDCKMGRKIKSAQKRAKENYQVEIKKSAAKNKLLNWLDWSKVTLREVAEHLGYKLTPYVER